MLAQGGLAAHKEALHAGPQGRSFSSEHTPGMDAEDSNTSHVACKCLRPSNCHRDQATYHRVRRIILK